MRNLTNLLFLSFLLALPAVGLAQNNNGLTLAKGNLSFTPCVTCGSTQDKDKDKIGVSVNASVFGVPSNPNSAGDSVGLGIGAEVAWRRYTLAADIFGDHNDSGGNAPTRARYHATAHVYDAGEWKFWLGGGAAKTGNELFGFGEIVAHYEDLALSGKYGSSNFVEAIAKYRIFSTPHFAVHPFYSYTGEELNANRVRTHRAGLQFTITKQ